MGKIRKNANIYSKDGVLLRKVGPKGVLEDYSIEELEVLIDELGSNKDDNGNIKDPVAFNNACSMLLFMYNKYGNPHKDELLKRLTTPKDEVTEALKEVDTEVSENVEPKDSKESEYIDFEEIKND